MKKVLLAACAAAIATPVSAGLVYSNNFDNETAGNTSILNYNSFNGLTVTDGTVDLVKSGEYSISCAGGGGYCVDLDGSTGNSGLTSSNSYAFAAGQQIQLSFDFSGNQRGGASDQFVAGFVFGGTQSGLLGYSSGLNGSNSFGFGGTGYSFLFSGITPGQPFSHVDIFFNPTTSGTVSFAFEDLGNDNVGIVLDNVSLSIGRGGAAVPEPATWAMLILGFGVVGAATRRRKAAMKAVFA